jgi:hypothetical protein
MKRKQAELLVDGTEISSKVKKRQRDKLGAKRGPICRIRGRGYNHHGQVPSTMIVAKNEDAAVTRMDELVPTSPQIALGGAVDMLGLSRSGALGEPAA